jgi:hypothetical protein
MSDLSVVLEEYKEAATHQNKGMTVVLHSMV